MKKFKYKFTKLITALIYVGIALSVTGFGINLYYCIANGILKDFLSANKAEVIKMSIYEYDQERENGGLKYICNDFSFKAGIFIILFFMCV